MLHNRWADPAEPFSLYLLAMETHWAELLAGGMKPEEISVWGVTTRKGAIDCKVFPTPEQLRRQLNAVAKRAFPGIKVIFTPHGVRHGYYARA